MSLLVSAIATVLAAASDHFGQEQSSVELQWTRTVADSRTRSLGNYTEMWEADHHIEGYAPILLDCKHMVRAPSHRDHKLTITMRSEGGDSAVRLFWVKTMCQDLEEADEISRLVIRMLQDHGTVYREYLESISLDRMMGIYDPRWRGSGMWVDGTLVGTHTEHPGGHHTSISATGGPGYISIMVDDSVSRDRARHVYEVMYRALHHGTSGLST